MAEPRAEPEEVTEEVTEEQVLESSDDSQEDDSLGDSSEQNGSIPEEEAEGKNLYIVYMNNKSKDPVMQFRRPGGKRKTSTTFAKIIAELEMMDKGGADGVSLQFDIPDPQHASLLMNHDLQKLIQLESLCFLDMTGVQLPDKDFKFGGLINLTSLTLDDTNIRLLHPSIGRLINLSYLSLRFNRLYDFPITMRLLRNLKHLDLTGNLFRWLPASVFHLINLKTIKGLNENSLEQYPGWVKGKQPIASTPPLSKPNPPRQCIDELTHISLSFAVGLNIWLIPLPDKFREEIARRCISRDLCENCLAPVKKIMADQESDGYLMKVCLDTFKQFGNVPFAFYTCSKECNDLTVLKFSNILKEQNRTNRKHRVEDVVLKPEYSRPVRITRKIYYSSNYMKTTSTDRSDALTGCCIS